jgi:hypothetical protein
MLTRTTPTTSPAATEATLLITGRCLERLLRGASSQQRAEIVSRLVTGQWRLVWPTPAEAARMARVHARLVHRALGHAPKRRRPSDADIDDGIARIGLGRLATAIERHVEAYPQQLTDTVIDRLMAMLDRATQPQLPLVAAE